MTRLSAHLGYLFADLPLADRPAAAARAGFDAVEHPHPFAVPAREMRARLDDLGLAFVQLAAGQGDPARGEKGLAALPGREREFRESLARALDYAAEVGAAFVHPMAGVPQGDWRGTYRANLADAVERTRTIGMGVLVEAIGPAAVPGYAVGSLDEALEVRRGLGAAVLFDTFHAASGGVDPAAWVNAHAAAIGHVHAADHPGRHEPGTGTIDFPAVLDALRVARYPGAIGFEYVPLAPDVGFLAGFRVPMECDHDR